MMPSRLPKMSNTPSTTTSWPSGATLLGVLFVGLKLTGHITWPWVWVLAPFWVPLAIALALLSMAGLLWAIANSSKKY
jgi:hypothetical protein